MDFDAEFDGKDWTVEWKWSNGPPRLKNTVPEYRSKLDANSKRKYDDEIKRWIENGWLVPWKGERGEVLPLMAVEQECKGKIRPVMDYSK